ncbi:hypothetical protein RTBOTA2_005686 [Rhodotorula toruloides]|uniref:Proteophosphoglycan ppg4 n=1 Tax=Rhodotorula toruloides TaxID=5286 RepID=A0A2T0A2N6_RHOTO|nr:hypothetical protein RTBOTA2_005686 [Rhodotorula toruloides]PRQ72266.1 hypothetical protein AAT19DRAFT_9605 [Rhodotorula toruloides]
MQWRPIVGELCESLTVTEEGGRFVENLPPVDLRNLLLRLPNLVKLDLTGSALVTTFCKYATAEALSEEGEKGLLDLRILALTSSDQVDRSSALPIEGLYPFRRLERLSLTISYLSRGTDLAPAPSFPSLRHLAFKFRIVHDLAGITRIIEASPSLQHLEIHDHVPQRNFHRLLEAAVRLGTVTDLTLEGAPYAGRWKVPKEIAAFTRLTKLSLLHGCTARRAPTFALFRGLPLESLTFGPKTTPSGSRLVKLVTGPTRIPTLRHLHLDNIAPGCCREIDVASASKADLKAWEDTGWTLSWFPCSFSYSAFVELRAGASLEGVELTGRTVEAKDGDARVWQMKLRVEQRLKELKKAERNARCWRTRLQRWACW